MKTELELSEKYLFSGEGTFYKIILCVPHQHYPNQTHKAENLFVCVLNLAFRVQSNLIQLLGNFGLGLSGLGLSGLELFGNRLSGLELSGLELSGLGFPDIDFLSK